MGSKEIDVEAIYTSDKEKTFQFQAELASLPVPNLQHTLDRYLDSVKPHVTADEYRQTEFIVQQFASGIGKDLHDQLVDKASTSRNWLDQWWTDYAYMDFRLPLAPYLNFAGPGPYVKHSWPPAHGTQIERAGLLLHYFIRFWQLLRQYGLLDQWWTDYAYMDFRLPISPNLNFGGPGPYFRHVLPPKDGTQLERAALVMHFSVKFWKMIRQERLKPDKDGRGQRLSMNQYYRAYSTCRIPGVKRDHLNYYFKTVAEGDAPLNLCVLCRGRIYTMKAVDENEEPLTALELQHQFQYVRDQCDKRPPGPSVGMLTGDSRTSWAQLRSRLISLHPRNYENLEEIQKSIMLVVLDDESPNNENELLYECLAGDPTNRWFDKSIALIFYKNGLVGSNCDHSPFDAMVLVGSTYYVDLNVMKCKGKWQGTPEIRELTAPRELDFILDDVLYKEMNNIRKVYDVAAKNLHCCTETFVGYGRKYLRKNKLHPDTHVQLAIQYAYYKMFKKPAPTYETATTRKFFNARTETMRSCTVEAIDWCKAMLDTSNTNETKYFMFKRASDRHNHLMAEAQENKGCDRHLLGLQILAIETGLPMPQLFTDPSYVKSGGGGNFILSTSFVGYSTVYGGVVPMCEMGYGCFYKMENNDITIFATSWESSGQPNATKFNKVVRDCLTEMKELIDSVENKTARL